ncbi:cyclic nucleotide-binding domain-containing protein [Endothiovibrio diazotrophicus]
MDASTDEFSAKQTAIDALERLEGLSPRAHQVLREVGHLREYRDGEAVLHEGEFTREIYVVAGGEVALFRDQGPDSEERIIAELAAGSLFGEMALVDGAPRSLSGRAKGGLRLLVIDPAEIEAQADGAALLTELKACFSVAVVRRMRDVTDNYVAVLERELEAARTQQAFGQFFIYTLGLMAVGTVVNNLLSRHLVHVDIYTQSFAWQYLLVLLVPSLVVMQRMGITMSDLGLSRKGLRSSLIAGLVVTLGAVALTGGLAATLYHFDSLPGKPLQFELGGTVTYLVHSFLQELVARGFLQNAFQRFLNDARGVKSVFLTSALFGLFHLHFGLTAVVLTVVSSIAFGLFYLRDRNLAGVTLIHFTTGVCAFASGLM